jgi:hypothetical protein
VSSRVYTVSVSDSALASDYVSGSPLKALIDVVLGDFEYTALKGRELRDSLVVADYAFRDLYKPVVDTGVSADRLSSTLAKIAVDVSRILDYFSKSPLVLEVDAARSRDVLSPLTGKTLEDALKLTDYMYKSIYKLLVEAAAVTDFVKSLRTAYVFLRDYVFAEHEAFRGRLRELLDSLRVAEYLSRAASRGVRDYSTIADYYSKSLLKTLAESSRALEYAARRVSKPVLEYTRILDAFARVCNYYMALVDYSAARDYSARAVLRVLAEATRALEYAAKWLSKRVIESGRALEYLLARRELYRSLLDYAAVGDYSARAVLRALADVAALIDVASALKVFPRAIYVTLRDYLVGEFALVRAKGMSVADAGRMIDVIAKVAYTLVDILVRRVYLLPPAYRTLWDLIASSDHNAKVNICKRLLEAFKSVRGKIGLESATVDSLISELEDLVNRMRYVKPGDEVRAEDTNLFVKYTRSSVRLVEELYELYKARTGRTLSEVEVYISSAELRAVYLREVMSMELVHPDHHNVVVDTLKYVERALREVERALG